MTPPPPGLPIAGNAWDALAGRTPDPPPRVSVVVIHFDQPVQLARTLAALARQDHPADRLEVLVVDDGSPSEPEVPLGVRLLRQEDRGFRAAAARNLGAAHATGDVLCFLDADTVPEPGYVRALTRLPSLAPEVVTVGRREHADLAAAPADAPVEEAGPAHRLPAPQWLADGYAASRDLLDADDRSYRFVISAVLACSRWLFDVVGGFGEDDDVYGGEDWEWAHRAWLAGAALAHVSEAVAWHDGPDWAGRSAADPECLAAKNAETLRLASRIAVPGSRPRALRGAFPDVLVRLAAAPSPAAAFVCVDSVLAALPEAQVEVPAAFLPTFADDPRVTKGSDPFVTPAGARVVVDLAVPVRVEGDALRRAVDRVGPERLGGVVLEGADGEVLATVDAQRAAVRAARWGSAAGFEVVRVRADSLTAVPAEPDLEAYLGGWG